MCGGRRGCGGVCKLSLRNNLRLFLKSRGKSLLQLFELSQRIRLSQHVEVL